MMTLLSTLVDESKKKEAPDDTKNKDSKSELAEEFLKTVQSKLKKGEKETWMLHDHDHLMEVKKK